MESASLTVSGTELGKKISCSVVLRFEISYVSLRAILNIHLFKTKYLKKLKLEYVVL